MGLVLRGKNLSSFSFGFHWLETGLALSTKQLLNQILLSLFNILITLFQPFLLPLQLSLHLLPNLSSLNITNHTVEVSEERFWVIVDVAFLLSINTKIVSLLKCSLVNVWCLAVEVLHFKFHHDFCHVFVDLLDEGGDGFCFWVEFVQAAQVVDEFDELVVNLSLVFRFLFLLGNFPIENLQKLWF